MALCNMKELLYQAAKQNAAVGSFSVGNMEMVMGAIKAAEEMNTSIILQVAEIRLKHSPLEFMAPVMIAAAKQAKVDVAVHFDHGATPAVIKQALELGFTSVMFDGSHLPLTDNISQTKAMVELASQYGADVEAELGVLGKDEAGEVTGKAIYTNPKDANRFVKEVPVTALAVAIGNAHGHYEGKPQLRFDVLESIQKAVNLPLVLHGGSGISKVEFRRCIDLGVRKINIATASFDGYTMASERYLSETKNPGFFGLNESAIEGVYENVKEHIQIFNNKDE